MSKLDWSGFQCSCGFRFNSKRKVIKHLKKNKRHFMVSWWHDAVSRPSSDWKN